ncbi:MAG: Na+/H+ antiporter NhaC family protein [Pseudomonadota bacterium]|nr:Na+/H+ antiporter NhaC family protein [Pseudomonadota bacterium]
MNIRSWGLLGALLLIGVALSASPAYPAELDLPRVMLKNISYDIPLDAGSLDQDTPLDAITLVADGRMIPLVRNDDQLIFENVRASESPQSFQILVEATVVGGAEVEVIPAWFSILPPLTAILVALLIRSVLPALVLGLWLGAWALNGLTFSGFFAGFLDGFDVYLTNAVADRDHVSIMLFTFMIAGMVGIISRNGGMRGIVELIIRGANTPKRGQVSVWTLGLLIFFDDYSNTLVVGNTSRSVTDRLKISREKLAYIVDSTAAPVATVALVTTMIGYQVGLIGDAMTRIPDLDLSPYGVFLNSILYSFYPFLAIFFVILVITTGRDFGPMLKAERRARETGQVVPDSSSMLGADDEAALAMKEGLPPRAMNAIIPVIAMTLAIMAGLYVTGEGETVSDIVGSANSYQALMWASIISVLVAAVMTLSQRLLSLDELVDAWVSGARFTFLAMIILVLSWAMAEISSELHTADFLIASLGDRLPMGILPTLVFVLAAFTAFSTGSSWGAMGILLPLVVPLSWAVLGALDGANQEYLYIFYASVSCVLAGAVWGDHCSPISDTTVMSSLSAGCDHIEHVRTQMPYALLVGVTSIVLGTLPVSFGMPWWLGFLLGAGLLALALRRIGQEVDTASGVQPAEL